MKGWKQCKEECAQLKEGDLLRWTSTSRQWIMFDNESTERHGICVGHTALITKIEYEYGRPVDFTLYHPQYGQTSSGWHLAIPECWEVVREEDLT